MRKKLRICPMTAAVRRLPHEFPVRGMGYIPEKRDRISSRFQTVNFSLILEGRGDYTVDGRREEVVGPAILTQTPGVAVDYGPRDWWREIFVVYDPRHVERFRHMGLLDRPWWPVLVPGRFLEVAEELVRTFANGTHEQDIDRIDRLADLAIAEAFLGGTQGVRSPAEQVVLDLRAAIDRDPMAVPDPERAAIARGLSRSNFRRLWSQIDGTTPARYVNERRLREAARVLVETDTPIAGIAADLGYGDPLYFGRCFRAFTGASPRDYRARNRQG